MHPELEPHRARRKRLLAQMAARGGGVLVLPTAPETIRNRDTHYPYRHDSYFYYLTGFTEPQAALVLIAARGRKRARQILFCRSRDAERELWDGFRYGPKEARERFGFDAAWPINELDRRMPTLLEDEPALFTLLGRDPAWDARALRWLEQVRSKTRAGVQAPARLIEARVEIDAMRLIKDADEIERMRQAAAISAAAHRRAMRATRPGLHEYAIEAELTYEFRRHGADAPAYPPIVASGANACILHYIDNRARLETGQLVLVDAGAEYMSYAGDITRTWPVSGRFSGPQREVYEIVLAAQTAALEQIRPGAPWNAFHEAAVRVLTQGLIDLGLLEGEVDGLIESGAYKRFYMHRTGHWLGLDVHDAGEYKLDGKWQPLEAGMTLTVEPGLYIRAGEGVPAALAGIGVRIEDDVRVTTTGHEILSADAPKTVAAIEEEMRAGREGDAAHA